MNVEKLQKMAGTVRTGGKGTVRRKKKAVHKSASTDDKKLQNTFKRCAINTIAGIEEVAFMHEDGTSLAWTNPKVQANVAGNTYAVSGTPIVRNEQDTLVSMFGGGMSPANIQQMIAQMQMQGGQRGDAGIDEDEDDDDDDVPELVGDFEQPE